MPERRRFLRGLVAWVGFDQVPVEYRRAGRHAGRGASYPQLLALALEALTAFSDVPLQLATLFGILIAQLSALGAIVILVLKLAGVVQPSVWVWVLAAVLILSGVQLTTVGILGRYLARVHAEVLGRPAVPGRHRHPPRPRARRTRGPRRLGRRRGLDGPTSPAER